MAAISQPPLDHQQKANELLNTASAQPSSIWSDQNKAKMRAYLDKQNEAHAKFFCFEEDKYIQQFLFPALYKSKTIAKFWNDAQRFTATLNHSASDKRKIRALMVSAFVGKKVGVTTCYKHDCITKNKLYVIEFHSYYFQYQNRLHKHVKLPTGLNELHAVTTLIKNYKTWCQRNQRVASTVNSWFRTEQKTNDEPPTWNPAFYDLPETNFDLYKEGISFSMRRLCMCLCLKSQAPPSFPLIPRILTIGALIEGTVDMVDAIASTHPRIRSNIAADNSAAVAAPVPANPKHNPEYIRIVGEQALLKEKQQTEKKQNLERNMEFLLAKHDETAKQLKAANERLSKLEAKIELQNKQLEEKTAKLAERELELIHLKQEKAMELENKKMEIRNLKRRLEAAGDVCSPLFPGNNNNDNNHNYNQIMDAPPPRKKRRQNAQNNNH